MERTIRIFRSHDEARKADRAQWAAMTREERMAVGQSYTPFGYGTTIQVPTEWTELCRLFGAHGVEFLLVEGHAVIANGYPRLTRDMDRLQDLADVEALEAV